MASSCKNLYTAQAFGGRSDVQSTDYVNKVKVKQLFPSLKTWQGFSQTGHMVILVMTFTANVIGGNIRRLGEDSKEETKEADNARRDELEAEVAKPSEVQGYLDTKVVYDGIMSRRESERLYIGPTL